jgi:glycosyltransferase involved in cell wall biosynthesis
VRRLTVAQLVPALNQGGAERSTLDVARALVQSRHRSIVISSGGVLVPRLQVEGSEHFVLPLEKKSLNLFTRAKAMRALLEKLQPDIVHVRSRYPAWVLRFALRGCKVQPKIISTVHGLNSPGFYSGIMLRADRIICVSETVRNYVKQHWSKTPDEKLCVIERGLDAAEFPQGLQAPQAWKEQLWRENPSLRGAPLLLMPARGTRLKGHIDAVELLAELRSKGMDARLWLLGAVQQNREKYIEEIRARAESLQVSKALTISPARQDVRLAYAVSDIVLQLSNQAESFGRTVLEALSVGKPVVGYAHGGVGDLLTRYFPQGRVPLGDITRAAEAVEKIYHRRIEPLGLPNTLELMQQQTLDEYYRLHS